MFNFSFFKGRVAPLMQATTGFDFGRLLNWRILRGSHEFPGPDGGTCVNEAAIVAAGYPYTRCGIDDCPASFLTPARALCHVPERDRAGRSAAAGAAAALRHRLAGGGYPEVDLQRVAFILAAHCGRDRARASTGSGAAARPALPRRHER